MIRVRVELVPGGVEELAYEVDSFSIACRFPLNHDAQDFHILHGDQYSQLKGFEATDGPDSWLDLVRAALIELDEHHLPLSGGEIFPGALALEPEEFGELLRRLTSEQAAVLHSVRLFGRRAREPVTYADFWERVRALPRERSGRPLVTGDFLAQYWPGYVEWDVAVRLVKKVYQTGPVTVFGRTYASRGHALEAGFRVGYGLRPYPKDGAPLLCGNGVRFSFIRPHAELDSPLTPSAYSHQGKWSSAGREAAPGATFQAELVRDIRAGPLLYDAAHGLTAHAPALLASEAGA